MVRRTLLAMVLALCSNCADMAPSGSTITAVEVPSATRTAPEAATTAPTASPEPEPLINAPLGLTFNERGADFGVVTLGSEVTSEVVLRNRSSESLTGLAVSLDGAEGSGFMLETVGAPCDSGTLPAGSTCPITVRYAAPERTAAPPELRALSTGARSGRAMEASTELTAVVTAWTSAPIPERTDPWGGSLAFGADGARVLHAAVASIGEVFKRRVEGEVVVDIATGYLRSDDAGVTWTRPQVMGGFGPAIAASGTDVYLVMRAYACNGGPGITINRRAGAPDAWSSTTCLAGRYGYVASVAAAGSSVIVATAARRPKGTWIHVSEDRGRTWTHHRLASAGGDPIVAAGGRTVVVATPGRTASTAWVSRDRGRRWEQIEGLPPGPVEAAAVKGRRFAIAGAAPFDHDDDKDEPGAPWLRSWSGAGAPHDAVLPGGEPDPLHIRALALTPGGGIGIVAGPGWDGCVSWYQSFDGGAAWSPAALPDCVEEPTLIVGDDGRPLVLAHGRKDRYVVHRGPAVHP